MTRQGGGNERITSSFTILDPGSGEIKKRVELPYPNSSGVLSTAGGIVITALLDGSIMAFDDGYDSKVFLAVSQTSDPAGQWHVYPAQDDLGRHEVIHVPRDAELDHLHEPSPRGPHG